MYTMRTFVGLAALIASFSIATSSCGGSTSGNGSSTVSTAPQSPPTQSRPSASAGNAVTVGNNVFTPGTIAVSAGQTVNWTWDACTGSAGYGASDTCVTHGIVFDDGVKSALQSE
jgi:plastocyanin